MTKGHFNDQHWSRTFVTAQVLECMGKINVRRSKEAPPGWCTVRPLTLWRISDYIPTFADIAERLEAGTLSKKNAKKELRAIFEVIDATA